MAKNRKRRNRMIIIVLLIVLIPTVAAVAILNHPSFGRQPQGERLERIKHSPHYREGQFQNLHSTPQLTSDKSRFRTMWDFLFEKKERVKPDIPLPAVKTDLHQLDKSEDLYVWFGHSSYLLQQNGVRFLIDPVLTNDFPTSFMFRPFKGTDIYSPEDMPDIDYLIITHDHWDHLDYNTVKQLKDRIGKVVCALGVGEHLEYWGFDKSKLIEMDWYETAMLPDSLTIHCLPARHFSGRSLSPNRTLWASYLLQSPSSRIYLSGDGGYDTHFKEIAEKFSPIDFAIMENGQYNKDWRYIHLMPEDLRSAIKDLHPKEVVTVHNSKFALSKHPWDEPMENARKFAAEDSFSLLSPNIGEVVYLTK